MPSIEQAASAKGLRMAAFMRGLALRSMGEVRREIARLDAEEAGAASAALEPETAAPLEAAAGARAATVTSVVPLADPERRGAGGNSRKRAALEIGGRPGGPSPRPAAPSGAGAAAAGGGGTVRHDGALGAVAVVGAAASAAASAAPGAPPSRAARSCTKCHQTGHQANNAKCTLHPNFHSSLVSLNFWNFKIFSHPPLAVATAPPPPRTFNNFRAGIKLRQHLLHLKIQYGRHWRTLGPPRPLLKNI